MICLNITLNESATPEEVERFRSFSEDVWRNLHNDCVLDTDEPDSETHLFALCSIKRSQLEHVQNVLERLMRRHRLNELVTVGMRAPAPPVSVTHHF